MVGSSSSLTRRRHVIALLIVAALSTVTLTTAVQVIHVATAGAADYPTTISGDSPVSWWRLGDSGCGTPPCTVVDEMSHYDGTADSSATFGVSGIVPGNDAVDISSGASGMSVSATGTGAGTLRPNNFSIEMWTDGNPYCAGFMSSQTIDWESDPLLVGGYELRNGNGCDGNSGPLVGRVALDGGASYAQVSTNAGLGVNHVVLTKDAVALRIYVNGVLQDSSPTNGLDTFYDPTFASDPIRLASPGVAGTYRIDELAFYDAALTSTQVRTHYYANPNWISGGSMTDAETRGGGSPTECAECAEATDYPVQLPSGEFWHTFPDFAFPGRGVPLAMSHTYSSTLAAHNGPLGYGWSMSYDMRLHEDSGSGDVTIHEENGAAIEFAPDPGSPGSYLPAAPRVLGNLVANMDGTWTFTRRTTAMVYTFDSGGNLITIASEIGDPGATTSLAYSSGKLATVTDAAGRTLTFTWSGDHVTGVADSSSPSRSVSFTYSSDELTDWTDVGGGHWHYTYDGSHRLLTMRDPNQNGVGSPPVITNHYDGSGRVDR